jgi:hypothetical protein
VAGRTLIGVVGAGFREVASLRCRFEASGSISVARYVSDRRIECVAPPSHGAGVRAVEVSMNGQQWSTSGVVFEYRPAPAVLSVSPTRGIVEGGTPVTVYGSGLSSSAEAAGALLCRFNASIVPAMYLSESTVVCNTTMTAAGYMAIEVSTNGRDYTSDGVQYEAVAVVLAGASPWSGPELGGTVVTVMGSGVASINALQCRFGATAPATLVPASSHGTNAVRCVSPSFAMATGWSSIELLSYGTTMQNAVSLFVHRRLFVSTLIPATGPVAGGTRIGVVGAGFREAASLR